jgi:hypothetical protein
LKSSPLLTSPSLQAICCPARANSGNVSFSRTHAMRSSVGSTTRTTTRLTVRNVSHVTVASKGTSAHPYLHNHPQHLHGHSSVALGVRFKKKKPIASIQRFHLPTSTSLLNSCFQACQLTSLEGIHLHSRLQSDHLSSLSPYHSNFSSSSSSSATTSIASSPSSQGAGPGISGYAHSPSMVWYALPRELYSEHSQPYYSYASTIALPPVAATGP